MIGFNFDENGRVTGIFSRNNIKVEQIKKVGLILATIGVEITNTKK